ncbi:MAG: DUF4404 family protein [Chloroflexi bacterium]|nr:DUF4404 family protein [Chloroflexota bacterium]MCL5275746.1 DUF4404 family protein [Chloroflexota bacterium]
MEQNDLREKLTALHDELARADNVDDNTRELLEHLSSDIQALLDRPGAPDDGRYRTLTGRLRGNLARFETSHPMLTSAMERAIDALVQMGV